MDRASKSLQCLFSEWLIIYLPIYLPIVPPTASKLSTSVLYWFTLFTPTYFLIESHEWRTRTLDDCFIYYIYGIENYNNTDDDELTHMVSVSLVQSTGITCRISS